MAARAPLATPPALLLHGELGGSWLWERYLLYFAQRGWEGHALNLRAHFWSETADFEELDLGTYLDDAIAGAEALDRPAVVIGHGMGALLAMKLAEQRQVDGLVLRQPGRPGADPACAAAHVVRLVPRRLPAELVDWAGPPDQVQRQNPDLTLRGRAARPAPHGCRERRRAAPDAGRSARRAGAAAGRAHARHRGGLDRMFPETDSERLADWLGAEYQPFGAHSHYGLVIGEDSHEQVADTDPRVPGAPPPVGLSPCRSWYPLAGLCAAFV